MIDEEAINILEKRLEKPEVACALKIAISALKVKKELIEQNRALWEANKILREGILKKSPLEGDWISAEELKKHVFKISDCIFEEETQEFVVSLSTINELLQQSKGAEGYSNEQLKKLDRINSTIDGLSIIRECAEENTFITTTLAGIELENKEVIIHNISLDSFLFAIDRAIQYLKDVKRRNELCEKAEEAEHGS